MTHTCRKDMSRRLDTVPGTCGRGEVSHTNTRCLCSYYPPAALKTPARTVPPTTLMTGISSSDASGCDRRGPLAPTPPGPPSLAAAFARRRRRRHMSSKVASKNTPTAAATPMAMPTIMPVLLDDDSVTGGGGGGGCGVALGLGAGARGLCGGWCRRRRWGALLVRRWGLGWRGGAIAWLLVDHRDGDVDLWCRCSHRLGGWRPEAEDCEQWQLQYWR